MSLMDNDKIKDYFETLLEQIRWKKAKPGIQQELLSHIEDQTTEYESNGMSSEDAISEAVLQMGDPVLAGTQLDRVHRPKLDKKMLLMVVILSISGFMIQYITGVFLNIQGLAGRQGFFMLLGFALMIGVYFMDYSWIGKYAWIIYWGLAVAFFLSRITVINGTARVLLMPTYLFVPAYAGVLFRLRKQGLKGILKAMLLMLPPLFLAVYIVISLPTALHLFLIFSGMLFLAVYKNWFVVKKGESKTKMFLLVLLPIVLLPILLITAGFAFLRDYQKLRILAFLNPDRYEESTGYVYQLIRNIRDNSSLYGRSKFDELDIAQLDSSYTLLNFTAVYGLLLGIMIVLALLIFVWYSFRGSFRIKNQLGMMLGAGCGGVFLIMILEGAAVNFGFLPSTAVLLPFLSYGGGATLVYDLLIGLLLSVYRYQNILLTESQPE